jgi:predicted ArsR family transcriptional regulator
MHLGRLAQAGLVVRERERRGQGRPRDAWSISADARPGGDPPTAYADLGRWLVRSISARASRARELESVGREIGRELAPHGPAASTADDLRDVLVALGFQPTSSLDREGTLTYTVANCPYREAVSEDQPVVCALHRGITRGLLDEISPRTKLTGFVPKDPHQAGCLIQVKGPLADRGGSATDLSSPAPPRRPRARR